MDEYSNNNGFLNSILSALNVTLEIVLALIGLGFLIGLLEYLS